MIKSFHQELKQELLSLAEPKYQKFQSALIPNVASETLLGVRLPLLRKIAKRIAKENPREYLLHSLDDSFEEIMLQGMVIGYWKEDLSEILSFVAPFVAKMDNWSVCDSFCCSLKLPKQYPMKLWEFLLPYCQSNKEYACRFGIVMMLTYYINEDYLADVFARLAAIKGTDYYIQMAIAWAISICYSKFPQQTLQFLEETPLADFVYNKALQKIMELKNSSAEEKAEMQRRKRE